MSLLGQIWDALLRGKKNVSVKLSYDSTKSEVTASTINNVTNNITINTINISNPGKKAELVKEIQEVIKQLPQGERVLKDSTYSLLNQLYKYEISKESDNKLLDFFKNVLSKEDLDALESSLFVRYIFNDKKMSPSQKRFEIRKLKRDISNRFSERGQFICNLCTPGYFEVFFIPLYNEAPAEFKAKYENFISSYRFAFFISHTMTIDTTYTDLLHKIRTARKYGLKNLYVHGIGRRNLHTTNAVFAKAKNFFIKEKITYKREYVKKDIIVIEIYL